MRAWAAVIITTYWVYIATHRYEVIGFVALAAVLQYSRFVPRRAA